LIKMEEESEDLLIRRVKKEELQTLIKVYQSAYKKVEKYAYRSENKIRSYLEWLYTKEPEGFWIAEKEGRITGFACIHTSWEDYRWGRTGELHEIAVQEELQGKGIGKKLFNTVLRYAREKRCRFLSLWVGEENWPARSWYQKLGFKEKGGWGEWVRMRKELSLPKIEKTDKNP